MPSSPHWRCALFGHKARHEPVWNDGFYFATCCRCGEDVVRIPGERWHKPHRAHVVWSATAPSQRKAALVRRPGAPLRPWAELPASSRIALTATREIRHGRQARAAVAEQRRSSIPDFMDDADAPLDIRPQAATAETPAEPGALRARPIRVA